MPSLHVETTQPLRRRRGRALLAAGAVGALALLSSASAVVADTDTGGEHPTQPASVTQQAYFTAPTSDAVPRTLRAEFPPAIVCVVIPESCGETAKQLVGPVETGLQSTIPAAPVQPQADGRLPVGLLGGQRSYASLLKFDLPPASEDTPVERFDVVLSEDGMSWALQSPAFRRLVRALIAQYSEGPSQEQFQALLEDIAGGEESLVLADLTGVEMCPVLEPWEPGDNQDAAELPEVDCSYGANGVRVDGTWTFDMGFAAQAWLDGTLPREGVYVGPVGPENLEYGDPDFTSSFFIAFGSGDAAEELRPRLAVTYGEPFTDIEPPQNEPAPDITGGSSSLPPTTGGIRSSVPPAVIDEGAPTARGDTEPEVADDEVDLAADEAPDPAIPLRMWLLVPLALAAAALFTRAVTAEPQVADGEPGALTALINRLQR